MKSLKCLFCSVFIALEYYFQKNNKNQYQSKFSWAYNVIFYYGYINQKRTKIIIKYFTINGFSVNPSYLILDAIVA